MTAREAADFLLNWRGERNPGFHAAIRETGWTGLKVIAAVAAILPAMMFGAMSLVEASRGSLLSVVLISATALILLAFVRTGRFRNRSRLAGCLAGLLWGSIVICTSLARAEMVAGAERYIPAQVAIVLLIAIVCLPLHPLHTFSLGTALTVVFAAAAWHGPRFGFAVAAEPAKVNLVFLVMLTFLATALSGVVYWRTYANYMSHMRELNAKEELSQAQCRVFLSENAATVARLAAALSHELNSPVGVLKSAMESLEQVAVKRTEGAAGQDPRRLEQIEGDLRASARKSAVRLQEIVARMQRITNLDRAEVQSVSLNAMLTDVTYLLESEQRQSGVAVELSLQNLPSVSCRPQQIGAVFTNIVDNAIRASEGRGCVTIETLAQNRHVEVRIRDAGKGFIKEALTGIFEPGFREEGGRVSTGNWGLFSARQIIREHAGEIRIESEPEKGTVVTVTLPADAVESWV